MKSNLKIKKKFSSNVIQMLFFYLENSSIFSKFVCIKKIRWIMTQVHYVRDIYIYIGVYILYIIIYVCVCLFYSVLKLISLKLKVLRQFRQVNFCRCNLKSHVGWCILGILIKTVILYWKIRIDCPTRLKHGCMSRWIFAPRTSCSLEFRDTVKSL